ncbi:serine--tRNA ligase [Bacteriovoracaceae bacterium]|nr:serine--tRNA ligase [Bacteriovoracaceae bacterium]
MHNLKDIETNPNDFKTLMTNRNDDPSKIDGIIDLNNQRKDLIAVVENSKAEIKSLSKEVGQIKKSGGNADEIMQKVADIKNTIVDKEALLGETEKNLNYELSVIPNMPQANVPIGKTEEDNVQVEVWGDIPKFSFAPKDHHDIGVGLGMLDFEAATKITGARFVVYKSDLALMERALANYMLDHHAKRGYEEIIPPLIVHERSMFGTGNFPKFTEDAFKIDNFDWYLIPTAEVPVTNMKREQVFNIDEFPMKYCAFTPCFRSEAGSHGRDTKGLIRMHQFNKVEMVNIVHPDESEQAHRDMVQNAMDILKDLKLPHRNMHLCSTDMSFASTSTFDLEVWLPGQSCYREISSISNCKDFQARRAGIRYKDQKNPKQKPQFAHTLNGSGLAVGRTLVAILENYQQEDGSVIIPEVLRPYMRNKEVIAKNK